MDLPFVIDVAVGLIFIFLILSLLASELQELLTTLLQWRATHLKDSIEVLLAGGVETKEEEHVKELVNKLYDDPLLKNLNQEAKGLAGKVREVTRWLIPGNQRGSFGAHRSTGPSYIAPETFATSILERVGLATLVRKLVEVRLEKFAKRIVGHYTVNPDGGLRDRITLPDNNELESSWDKGRVRLIAEAANVDLYQDGNFKILVEEFDDILKDFKSGESNLPTSVERMGESFSTYIGNYPIPDSNSEDASSRESTANHSIPDSSLIDAAEGVEGVSPEEASMALLEDASQPTSDDPDPIYFAKRLRTLKLGIFGVKSERAIASGGLRPSLMEIAELLNRTSGTYQEVTQAYQTLRKDGKDLDAEVLPRLKEMLLASHHVDAVEKELIARHLDDVIAELTVVLQTSYPKWYRELKVKLERNDQQLLQAEADAQKPVRRRRGLLRRTRTWFVRQWRRFTVSTPRIVLQKRRWIVAEMVDRLPEGKQLALTRAVLDAMTAEEHRHKLYGDVDKGCFGVIDHALDRLTNEERLFLVDKVLTELNYDNERRSLYDNYQTYKTIQLILGKLPNSVKESFVILARRAQIQARETGNDVNQFRKEVADWFDHSMSRASGVYKRNAKGVGILIGLLLVIATNVDAGFIVDRLSNDEHLRDVIATRATSTTSADERTLDQVRSETNEALKELALPIGWNPANVADQLDCQVAGNSTTDSPNNSTDSSLENWDLPSNWSDFYDTCLVKQATDSQTNGQSNSSSGDSINAQLNQESNNPFQKFLLSINHLLRLFILSVVNYPLAASRILMGWLIAGIAISMGAPFWFDLLGKFVNVRNAGGKPASIETQSVAKPATAEITVKQEPQ